MASGGARRSGWRRAVALRAVGAEERRWGAIYRRRSRARPVAAWRDAGGGQLGAVRASTAAGCVRRDDVTPRAGGDPVQVVLCRGRRRCAASTVVGPCRGVPWACGRSRERGRRWWRTGPASWRARVFVRARRRGGELLLLRGWASGPRGAWCGGPGARAGGGGRPGRRAVCARAAAFTRRAGELGLACAAGAGCAQERGPREACSGGGHGRVEQEATGPAKRAGRERGEEGERKKE